MTCYAVIYLGIRLHNIVKCALDLFGQGISSDVIIAYRLLQNVLDYIHESWKSPTRLGLNVLCMSVNNDNILKMILSTCIALGEPQLKRYIFSFLSKKS